ncbi:MAG: hypothetical protein IPH44_01840 [Myxococcales bacterium]|nr:hypothetical protein [Myxococcales bacterium]MBK7198059.1 hypothetical protein [Myxococcales bacterium]MBP6845431.1 hypothetical protein [Kofleriaceae bacterium]
MSPRWITAAWCGLAAALLIAAALSSRWLVADVAGLGASVSARIGLTSVKVCASTLGDAQCQEVAWSQLPGQVEGSGWMWIGRATFALCLIAALGLIALGGMAVAELEVQLPIPAPRLVLWPCLALLPFIGAYYLFPPRAFSELAAGRGFAFGVVGGLLGAFAAWRQLKDDWR